MEHGGDMGFDKGQRVRIRASGVPEYAQVRHAMPSEDGGWSLFVVDDAGGLHEVAVPAGDTTIATVLTSDGAADSSRVLAGMWTRWMTAAATNAESTLLASTPLNPYAHQ